MWLKVGRFGPFVEMAAEPKPKRASLPKGWPPPSVDLEKALRLLRLPREVGMHPDDGKPILAGIGRYGPYVQHDGTYANIESADEVFDIGLNRAVTVLAEKRAGGPGPGRRAAATAPKDLGAHPARRPAGARPLRPLRPLHQARRDERQCAPRARIQPTLTMEWAVALLAEREAKGGRQEPAWAARAAKFGHRASPKAANQEGAAKKHRRRNRRPRRKRLVRVSKP